MWLFGVGIIGCMVGSFLNVVIYRLPLMLERRWQREAMLQLGQTVPAALIPFNLMLPVHAVLIVLSSLESGIMYHY